MIEYLNLASIEARVNFWLVSQVIGQKRSIREHTNKLVVCGELGLVESLLDFL